MGKVYLYIVATCCILLLQSCESRQKRWDAMPPYMVITVLKFSSPQYLDYVVAKKEKSEDNEFYKIGGVGGTCKELYIGHSPYIALPKGYYTLDWKWGRGIINRPENYLIGIKWEEVENRQQKWPLNTTIISSDFITHDSGWRATSYELIDKALNIAPPTEMDSKFPYIPADYLRKDWMGRYNSLEEIPESQREEYLEWVRYQDSLQEVYIERLSQVILIDDSFSD